MKGSSTLAIIGATLAAASLSGCGGGGGGGNTSSSATSASSSSNTSSGANAASVGGIWRGTDPLSGQPLLGLVTETGRFHFFRYDGSQFYGVIDVTGTAFAGTFQGATKPGFIFIDGSRSGTGTFDGTVTERTTLSGRVTFTTARGNSLSATATLAYDNAYNAPSSLSRIAGLYQDEGGVVSVSGGTIFEQNTITGCTINGTVSIINSNYNAYDIQYQFSGCLGSYAFLNGTTATGIGMIDTSVSPERAVIGVTNTSAGYSLVGSFPRI